jgi:hypothetical protein
MQKRGSEDGRCFRQPSQASPPGLKSFSRELAERHILIDVLKKTFIVLNRMRPTEVKSGLLPYVNSSEY